MVFRVAVEIKQNGHTLHSKGSQLTALHVTNYTLMQSEGNEASNLLLQSVLLTMARGNKGTVHNSTDMLSPK
jgi:hypothetical protein